MDDDGSEKSYTVATVPDAVDGDATQADPRVGNSSDTFFSDIEINSDDEDQTHLLLNGHQLDLSGDNSLLLNVLPPETPAKFTQTQSAQDLSTQAKTLLERHKQVLIADTSSWSDHAYDDVQVLGTPIERTYAHTGHPASIARRLVPIDSDGEDTGFIEETPFKSPPLKLRKVALEPAATGTPLRAAKPQNTIPATPPLNQCMLFYWPGDGWYPAIPDQAEYLQKKNDPKAKIVVEFGTEEEGLVKASSAVPVDFQVGDIVNYEKIQYKIIQLIESGDTTKFVTSMGYDTLKLEPLRISRRMQLVPITVLVKDVFLRNAEFDEWNSRRLSRESSQRIVYPSMHSVHRPKLSSYGPSSSGEAPTPTSQIFSHCMFSITMASHRDATSVTNSIRDNSGEVVEDFSDILDVDANGRVSWNADPAYTFGAVIAARPLRSPKYLGGLAMGWPCLSFQFIADCVAAGRLLENWKDYLLAAGDSLALKSAISLDMTDFYRNWATGYTLKTQFEQRPLAMGGLVPDLYLVRDQKNKNVQLLLRLATAKPPKIVDSLDEITATGVVVVLAKSPSDLPSDLPSISSTLMVGRLHRQLILPETAVYNRDWLIQCIINRRLV